MTISTAPMKTGVSKNDQSWCVSIINKGLAPAGGCVVSVNIMEATPSPVAKAKENDVTPNECKKINPINAVIK